MNTKDHAEAFTQTLKSHAKNIGRDITIKDYILTDLVIGLIHCGGRPG